MDKTTAGRALDLAKSMAASEAIGEEQAKVYAFRNVFGIGRAETAERLNKSPNTVDNLRSEASRRVFEARSLVAAFERDRSLVEVRRSRKGTWHRDPHGRYDDPEACRPAAQVIPRKSYEYRIVPEDELTSLGGELCTKCFSGKAP